MNMKESVRQGAIRLMGWNYVNTVHINDTLIKKILIHF